jgi:glutamyl/glutaminyl-tRNA synthetase
MNAQTYRGRIAPSPTGYLHVGHAMTFWEAQERARAANGKLILRIDDVDLARCRSNFREAIEEDLRWFGIEWDEGPYLQSERFDLYREALTKLRERGFVYPCRCSRKDVAAATLAPHDDGAEAIYPGTCRSSVASAVSADGILPPGTAASTEDKVNWRFRVPDGEEMRYVDLRLGEQRTIAGKDFGDFILWRRDDVPAYQLAVVVDDSSMGITEVVRGEDLRLDTFRQLLIYRALDLASPKFYHAPLIVDLAGRRLAKRDAAMSLRALRERGVTPEQIHAQYLEGRALSRP